MLELLILNDNVKEIIIRKEEIKSNTVNGSIRNLDINLNVQVVYYDQQNQTEATTVAKYINYWLYEVKKKELKQTSFDRLENTVNHQIIAEIGEKELSKLSGDDIQNMIESLKDKAYSYSTIKKAIIALRACLKYAVFKGIISSNPSECIEFTKKEIDYESDDEDVHFLSDGEIKKFKREALTVNENGEYTYRLGNVFILLLTTGIRVGEALALRWDDINFESKTMRINKNLSIVKNRNKDEVNFKKYILIEQKPKTKNSNRVVPLSETAIKALHELNKLTGDYKLVIANKNGSYVLHKNLDRTYKKILANAGLNKTGIHTLRHTFASKLFRSGIEIKTISEILGHSDVGVTSDIYIHIIQEQKMRAINMMDTV